MKLLLLISLLFICMNAIDGKKLKWNDIDCDAEMADQLRNVTLMTIKNYYLYIMFEKFSISIPSPNIFKTPVYNKRNSKEEINLEAVEFITVAYKQKETDLQINTYDIKGMFQGLWKGYFYTYAYLPSDQSPYYVDFESPNILDLGQADWYDLSKMLTIRDGSWVFVHWDEYKYFQIYYRKWENMIGFRILQSNMVEINLNYWPKFAIYYEYWRPGRLDFWKGELVEIDHGRGIHFSAYLFEFNNTELSITERLSASMSMQEFFRCRVPPTSMRQIKGIWFKPEIYRFHVFVDDYYLVFDEDILALSLNLFNSETLYDSIKKVQFESDQPIMERIRYKYVKAFEKNLYFTFNQEKTYEATELEIEKGERIIKAVESTIDLQKKCSKQVLAIQQMIFCFEERQYYFQSKKLYRDTSEDTSTTQVHEISAIFEGTNVSFSSAGKLELIFEHSSMLRNDKETATHIVLVTEFRYYKILKSILQVEDVSKQKDGTDFRIIIDPSALKQKMRITEIFVGQNCMIKKYLFPQKESCPYNDNIFKVMFSFSPFPLQKNHKGLFVGALTVIALLATFVFSSIFLVMKTRSKVSTVGLKNFMNNCKQNLNFGKLKNGIKNLRLTNKLIPETVAKNEKRNSKQNSGKDRESVKSSLNNEFRQVNPVVDRSSKQQSSDQKLKPSADNNSEVSSSSSVKNKPIDHHLSGSLNAV